MTKGHSRIFWGEGEVLYVDMDWVTTGYIHLSKLSKCTLKICVFHCI